MYQIEQLHAEINNFRPFLLIGTASEEKELEFEKLLPALSFSHH